MQISVSTTVFSCALAFPTSARLWKQKCSKRWQAHIERLQQNSILDNKLLILYRFLDSEKITNSFLYNFLDS